MSYKPTADIMKILVFSDIHDDEIMLEKLKSYYKKNKFDYVFICGDITNHSVSFAEDVIVAFPNCFLVPGNNEPQAVMDFLKTKDNYIHEKRVELRDGLNVVGFGYSNITPFGTPNEYSESEIYERMSKLKIDNNTLLITHCPPYGYFDEVRGKRIGSSSIKRIVEEKQPLAILCGHVHEYEGVAKVGRTELIKVPAANNNKLCDLTIRNKNTYVEYITV